MNASVLFEIVEFFFLVCQPIAHSSQNWVQIIARCVLIGVPKIFRYQIHVSLLLLWSKFLWCLGAFIVLKNFSFILTEKCLLLHMGVHKPFISFLLCTWKWSNNWVFCCNYLPFTFVNCNFCLFCNENQLVRSLEKHLRLWTVSNEQIVFWCKWKAELREVFLFLCRRMQPLNRLCPYFLAELDCPTQKHKQASAYQQQNWDTNLPNTGKWINGRTIKVSKVGNLMWCEWFPI